MVKEEDDLNIELAFFFATMYDQGHFVYFHVPKGTWITVEVIKYIDRDTGIIMNVLKLNNNLVYSKTEESDSIKSLVDKSQSVEIFNNVCSEILAGVCVDGFYRNLQVDFGTCGGPGLNEFLMIWNTVVSLRLSAFFVLFFDKTDNLWSFAR